MRVALATILLLGLLLPLGGAATTNYTGRWTTTYLDVSYSDLEQEGPRRTTDATLAVSSNGTAWTVTDPYETFGCDDPTHVWYEYNGLRLHGTGSCSLTTELDGSLHARWSAPALALYLPDHDPLVVYYGKGEGTFR
jgi:hypothetical protein